LVDALELSCAFDRPVRLPGALEVGDVSAIGHKSCCGCCDGGVIACQSEDNLALTACIATAYMSIHTLGGSVRCMTRSQVADVCAEPLWQARALSHSSQPPARDVASTVASPQAATQSPAIWPKWTRYPVPMGLRATIADAAASHHTFQVINYIWSVHHISHCQWQLLGDRSNCCSYGNSNHDSHPTLSNSAGDVPSVMKCRSKPE
jgi:hypothetical protein